ncbi:hypothetical protein BC831DRAFT_490930 [Entophlyctis helioformis]|nr:hypothetical protein BC831DRAFT_490930 [Entophlyctis helioformis]
MLAAADPSMSASAPAAHSALHGDDCKVALVTGANTGIGFGIVERLIEHFEAAHEPVTIVLACRNRAKAQEARAALIARYFPAHRSFGERTIQLLAVDLSNTKSVLLAAADFKRRFRRLDFLALNAGIMPVAAIDAVAGAVDLFTRPLVLAKSGGNALVQRAGLVTAEGLGEVFAANVFGHYLLVRELEDELARSGDARVVWMSSTTADPALFDDSDWQCVKSKHPYEASKRLSELVALEMQPDLSKRGIHTLLASPGNVSSGITQGAIFSGLLVVILYILRFFGASGINITGRNGATSTVALITSPDAKTLDPTKVYHSEINLLGRKWVVPLTIDQGDAALRRHLVGEMETLRRKFRDLARSEGLLRD